MLVPGPWRQTGEVVDGLRVHGITAQPRAGDPVSGGLYVDVVADDELARGFAWGRHGALAGDLLSRVDACRHAAVVEIAQRLDECAPRVAALGHALRALGGVAVRMEASGGASAWEPWLERLESRAPVDTYEAGVILVRDADALFTCGMHQFDLPDAEISMQNASAAAAWLDAFSVFQLVEQPVLASGHTFRPDAASRRRVIERWPDHRHHPDDGRHNPFGVWRFLPEGAPGLEARNPRPTIIPSLVALLAAAERSEGGALTREEVEQLVAEAPAIAMDVADALALERGRGYADIEPELAWEQWQLVRSTMS